MKNASSTSGSIGFGGLLTIVFIVLKLCGVISWNWFWVCSPLIFTIGFNVIFIIIWIIIFVIKNRG